MVISTSIFLDLDPPDPAQVNVYVVEPEEDSKIISSPEVALFPLQEPDAAHESALVEDQINVISVLIWTLVDEEEKFTDGDGDGDGVVGAALVSPPPQDEIIKIAGKI